MVVREGRRYCDRQWLCGHRLAEVPSCLPMTSRSSTLVIFRKVAGGASISRRRCGVNSDSGGLSQHHLSDLTGGQVSLTRVHWGLNIVYSGTASVPGLALTVGSAVRSQSAVPGSVWQWHSAASVLDESCQPAVRSTVESSVHL